MKSTPFLRIRQSLARYQREETGATLVELTIVLPLFLLVFFSLLDFGRMGAEYVMADKATQLAARIAVVRPPACPGVPQTNVRGSVPINTAPPRFGTNCTAASYVCAAQVPVSCSGNPADPTVAEIWAAIAPIMPRTATPANLWFNYTYDPRLGFLGGPYTPVVTVEIRNVNFQFVTPIGGLAAMVAPNAAQLPPATVAFPTMSKSLPGEDLALGTSG